MFKFETFGHCCEIAFDHDNFLNTSEIKINKNNI